MTNSSIQSYASAETLLKVNLSHERHPKLMMLEVCLPPKHCYFAYHDCQGLLVLHANIPHTRPICKKIICRIIELSVKFLVWKFMELAINVQLLLQYRLPKHAGDYFNSLYSALTQTLNSKSQSNQIRTYFPAFYNALKNLHHVFYQNILVVMIHFL